MTVHPLIVTIILNTNRREDTLECLASLGQSGYPRHRVIVLDNASTDGSVEAIHEKFPSVEVVVLTENLGYAGNNNVGIRLALEKRADWILLLNEDTLVGTGCIEKLVEIGSCDPKIGILGPLVLHASSPDVIQSAGGRLGPTWEALHLGMDQVDSGQFFREAEVDWISGCCIMLRREVLEEVGPIDERFFYYWEETELCIRAQKAGWRIVHVPQARIWHKGVQQDYEPGPSVTYYATRNRLLTLSKHRAPVKVRFMVWAEYLRTLSSWTLRPKWKAQKEHRRALWRGLLDYRAHRWGKMPNS